MSTPRRSVVLHGHFYQPPREDPWFDEVEAQPSAAPDHDWNARIERECYRAVVAARILDGDGRIEGVVNTLERISFDVGPTLLHWMERHAPGTYAAILEADRRSVERLGHGNAIAMAFHHPILPLSDPRDRLTEIRWGIADFRRRFGRPPEGMWMPETAMDAATLDALAGEGIRFTIVAPHQIDPLPPDGGAARIRTLGGHEIAVFAYDGDLARGVAFGELLHDARQWAERWAAPGDPLKLVSLAVDGETFGHHHRFADMALAAVLRTMEQRPDVQVENFASWLARNPAVHEARLVAPSAWSCAHGVERWRSECGCKLDPSASTRQTWRAPLRAAVDWLAEELHGIFAREGAGCFHDPWRARDAYGGLPAHLDARERLAALADLVIAPLPDPVRALELLEMERNALRIFTSCAWFFDDLARIEPIQILRYAARGIELAGTERARLDEGFRTRLAVARSNDATEGTGADIYARHARTPVPAEVRAAAGGALLHRLNAASGTRVGAYDVHVLAEEPLRTRVEHVPTGRTWSFEVRTGAELEPSPVVRVRDGDGAETRLELADLPEAARIPVTRALEAGLLDRVLGEPDRHALLTGVPRDRVVRRACLHRVDALVAHPDPSPDRVIAALDAARLVRFYRLDVPFEAQTALWRWLDRLGHPAALTGLAHLYGIAAGGP
ncbi:MAG: DUF3536 domain-containing protein [Gemmatimonadota bacterium]|nr:DUF3536 domain-containing protein [Gemmatimonadota bacterium]